MNIKQLIKQKHVLATTNYTLNKAKNKWWAWLKDYRDRIKNIVSAVSLEARTFLNGFTKALFQQVFYPGIIRINRYVVMENGWHFEYQALLH
jgi:hypothetical protein